MRDIALEKRDTFNLRPLFTFFMKVVALIFIVFAIRHWLIAIGYPRTDIRFDTMSSDWQTAIAVLSVMQPVVAVGLWNAVRWGYVVWAIAVTVEFFMYVLMQETFGEFWSLIYFHVAVACVLILYLITETLRSRRA